MVQPWYKNNFLNSNEKIEGNTPKREERESLLLLFLLLLHHQLVISDGGPREAQSVKNRPQASTGCNGSSSSSSEGKRREARPAGCLSAIPRSRNAREKSTKRRNRRTLFVTWQHLKRCPSRIDRHIVTRNGMEWKGKKNTVDLLHLLPPN